MKRSTEQNLPPELLGIASLNFAAAVDSSARQEMVGSHLSQTLVIDGAKPRKIYTGMERRFGEATFNVRMRCNGEIKLVADKYIKGEGPGSIRSTPLTTLLFENIEKGELDILDLPRFHCKHNHFGFRYKPTSAISKVGRGQAIMKNTVLLDSPNVDARGEYSYGTDLQVAFLSLPGVLEDGMIISESVAKKLTSVGFEKRFGVWGHRRYPLNLYGNAEEYKPHPDIEEHIRNDGLLFAFREYDELLAGVEMAEDMLREVDHAFDRRVYAVPGAKVIDVTARKGSQKSNPQTPETMNQQAIKYYRRHKEYYAELTRTTDHLIKSNVGLSISPRLHHRLLEGHIFTNELGKHRPRLIYNLQELDEWRVDITFEYKVVPNIGSKISDVHGGKGVICSIWKDEDMPVDMFGTRAELIRDGTSLMKRMNPGAGLEQYFNAQGDAMIRRLQAMKQANPSTFYKDAWDLLLVYYELLSPRMAEKLRSPRYKGTPKQHVDKVLREGVVSVWMPTVSPITLEQALKNLEEVFPLQYGPLKYRDPLGQEFVTVKPTFIGSVYTILLEKTGDEWSGVASAKLNHFGLTSKINRHDKHATPARPMPVRFLGESEVRLIAAAAGGRTVAELVEMSNSPQLHRHIVGNIVRSKTPTNLESTITDESLVGRGGRNLAFLNHSLEIAGVRFVRHPASTEGPKIYPPRDGEPVL